MAEEQQAGFPYQIDGKQLHIAERAPFATQLLSNADFEPADNYVLIQRTAHGSKVLDSEEPVDLEQGHAEFFAFESGEVFQLTVNEHPIWWGREEIEISKIRHLANVPQGDDLIWMRDESTNETLPPDGQFRLSGKGIEHLRTHKRPPQPVIYEYFVAGIKYTTDHAELTGAQITAKVSGWNAADSLVLEGEGSEPDEIIHPTTIVVLKGRETPAQFAIVPPATFGGV
jgi:hypothetical protein